MYRLTCVSVQSFFYLKCGFWQYGDFTKYHYFNAPKWSQMPHKWIRTIPFGSGHTLGTLNHGLGPFFCCFISLFGVRGTLNPPGGPWRPLAPPWTPCCPHDPWYVMLGHTPWSCSCRLKEKFFHGVIFLVQYISQTLPKIPDAPSKLQRPTLAPRRSLEFTDAPVNSQTLPESSQRFRFHWQTMWLVRAYNIGYIIIFDP